MRVTFVRGTVFNMSTLAEIELAARRLTPAEKQQLLVAVAQSLRQEGKPLPEPRSFSAAEMQAWMDEDERDFKAFKGQG